MKTNKKLLLTLFLSVMALTSCGGNKPSADISSTKPSSGNVNISIPDPEEEVIKHNVTFNLNYEGAAAPTVVEGEQDKLLAKPANPTRDGFTFLGWSTVADKDMIFDFSATKIYGDTTLYARWGEADAKAIKVFTAEAEFSPCITGADGGAPIQGSTYSGGANGRNLIQEDYDNAAKSNNGYYVHFLYSENNNLKFVISADQAITGVTIYMRLSAEYKETFSISKDNYTIKLNGTALDYGTITFTDVPLQGGGRKAFEDFKLVENATLNQGDNTIEMITSNKEKLMGTAESTAPMIDCLKFYHTEGTLTWPTACPENIVSESE